MTERSEPPHLFGWGRGGVPAEFESYLRSCEASARWDRGERDEGIREIGFAAEGVSIAATDALDRLAAVRTAFLDQKGKAPYEVNHPGHEIRCMLYLLHAYCAKWNKPAPPVLLWLTLEVLGLKEGRPAVEVDRLLRLDAGVVDRAAFAEGAALDGEADGAGRTLNVTELAGKVGVSRDTLRRWRGMRDYRNRRDFVTYTHGKKSPHADSWAEAINRVNAQPLKDGDGKV